MNLNLINIISIFQEIFNLLKSYHINFLHIKYLRMVCIKKFSFKINNIIDNLSGDK